MHQLRICKKCERELDFSEFYKKKDWKDGYDTTCIKCRREESKIYCKKNAIKISAYNASRRAKISGLKNDLNAKEWEECLEYFHHKDAYTGMPLISTSIDHIIPVSENGDLIKNNVVPCNTEINTSKLNHNLLEWYPKQEYFSQERLDKILEWMGNYKKYLYVPNEQIDLIDKNDTNTSIQHFSITTPDNKKIKLYYSNRYNKNKFTMLVKRCVLDKYEDMINDKWIWLGKFDPFRYNHEDKVKNFLNRCSDFILLGEMKNGNLFYEDTNINTFEVPVSNTNSDIEEYFLGDSDTKEYYDCITKRHDDLLYEKYTPIQEQLEELYENKKVDKRTIEKRKRHKTMYKKFDRIFDKPDFVKLETVILTNKDVYGESSNPEFDKKNFRNAYKQNALDVQKVSHKGWKGLINKSHPYESAWCYVWADNTFDFLGTKYEIDVEHEETKKYKDLSKTTLRGKNTFISYDKIFIIKQFDRIYFFDLNMNRIENKFITTVESSV